MKTKLNEYREQFTALGVESENEMVLILDYLDSVAQVCYEYYISEIKRRSDDKEKENSGKRRCDATPRAKRTGCRDLDPCVYRRAV